MKYLSNSYKVMVLAIVSALALTSCGDYLEIEPRNIITEDNFWDEKADVEQMVLGCYAKMQEYNFLTRCIVWGEVRSDNVINGSREPNDNSNGKADKALYDLTRTPRSDNYYTTWVDFYNVINRCNILIKKSPEVAAIDPNFSDTESAAFMAECSGIRALCYFYLVRTFNNVPFYFDAIQSEDEVKNLPVTPRDEILDALISDLESNVNKAYKALPGYKTPGASRYNSNRFTQNAIYALLCDLCLWRGRYDDVVRYADIVLQAKLKEYDELEYSSEMMSRSYSGVPKLFMHPDDKNAPSMVSKTTQKKIEGYPLYTYFSEGLLGGMNDYRYNFGASYGNGFEGLMELNYYMTSDENGTGWANESVGRFYGNRYTAGGNINNSGNGLLFAESTMGNEADETVPTPTGNPKNKFFLTKYDTRYYTTFEREESRSGGGSAGGALPIRKFNASSVTLSNNRNNTAIPYFADFSWGTGERKGNWIFYRLTDVMLMKAEALIKLNRLEEAFYLIWVVNRRCEIGTDSKTLTETKKAGTHSLDKNVWTEKAEYMKKLLLSERQREFLFEGKRWFDLIRFAVRDGDYETLRNATLEKYSAGGTSSDIFPNENSLFLPYNKNELKKVNANGIVIAQNPYYQGEEDDD